MKTIHIFITGIVQGVGFRPFVYGLAKRFDLRGWVNNTSAGVDIVVQGDEAPLEKFLCALKDEAPPLAHIDSISAEDDLSNIEYSKFDIRHSTTIAGAFQPISPDVAICADCERELFNPHDRRYLYPFINCTNCGPRFTIIKDLPYDRPATTMAPFPMCADCRAEYDDPRDRRFHAQPVACQQCGPHVWLIVNEQTTMSVNREAILRTRRLLREGMIVAIKGLGGFHLACDAANSPAVETLRARKGRQGKPFAVMAADVRVIETLCALSAAERDLLAGHEKPIVLLERKPFVRVAAGVAPGMVTLGVMLPYTPLHHLLLNQSDPLLSAEPVPPVLVMTSGNLSEEPIVTANEDALTRLEHIADAFLLHDREIETRADDSVVRADRGPWTVDGGRNAVDGPRSTVYLRRSRGYAPYPVQLPFEARPTLAVGGELKNTFCLTRERYAFLSQHIGDMENVETYESFEKSVAHLARLFRVQPEIIAYDLHPNYFTTQYATSKTQAAKLIAVQHHHAHIAACMADNGLANQKVVGLAFDGTGYGTDGNIWGGEVLLADYAGFERLAHFEYLPLPGGDAAIRKPWRIASGYAAALNLDISALPFARAVGHEALAVIAKQVAQKINAPLTASLGRLFDAVACLAGVRSEVTYEAQAALELEVLSQAHSATATPYPYTIEEVNGVALIRVKEMLAQIIQEALNSEAPGLIGARFHNTIAEISFEICNRARNAHGLNAVALSGGVWQNQLLLKRVRAGLLAEGFNVYVHQQTPANDGGLALGQAAIANHIPSPQWGEG